MPRVNSMTHAAIFAVILTACGGTTTPASTTDGMGGAAGVGQGSTGGAGTSGGGAGGATSGGGAGGATSGGGAGGTTSGGGAGGTTSGGGAAGAAGGGGATGGSGGGPLMPKNLEIYSWWTAGSERTALFSLFDEVKRRYPAIAIVNAAQDRADEARRELPIRIANGNPPDSFQVIAGTDLRSWSDKGLVEPLESMSIMQGWRDVFPKGVLDAAGQGGVLFALPFGVERANTLFFNKTVLQARGVSAPLTVADFFKVAADLKNQGVTALAVSASGGWPIGSQLFESVLVAEAGPDFVKSYLAGQKAADAPEIVQALTDLGKMMDYANADRATTGWGTAVAKVCSGEAAMLFLPDFVRAQFAIDGCGPDKVDYVAMEPPATPTFVFVAPSFPIAKGAPHHDGAVAFLEVAGSAEGQRIFNLAKGTVPARTDVPSQGFDVITQKSMKDFATPGEHHVLAYAAAASFTFQEQVNPALQQFVDPSNAAYKNVNAVVTVLKQNYANIAR